VTVLTDTQVVTASGGLVELGYVERTTSQSVTATTFAGASEVFATDLTFVADGSPVVVEFYAPQVAVGGTYIVMNLSDGSTGDLGQIGYAASSGTAKTEYRYTPSAGVQTLNVRAWVQSGTGSLSGGAGGSGQFPPILLRVSKIVQATQWPAVTTGTIICTSSTRPASPFAGQQIYETDTSKSLIYNGTAWVSPQAQTVPPLCRAYQSANTSIPNNSTTTLSYNAENYDTDSMHSTTTNTSRITIVTAGVYAITAGIVWDINATGIRVINLRINAATNIAFATQTNNGASNFTEQTVSTHYSLAAADYVETTVYQNSGGALGARGDVTNGLWLCAAFLGKTA